MGMPLSVAAQLLPTPVADNSRGNPSATTGFQSLPNAVMNWGQYAAAIARWEHTLSRTAPDPTETGPTGRPRLAPPFVEWMMGLPSGWVTDTPGITRTETLKALGNGVVPQQATAALRHLAGMA